ncbi:MAG: hypothetical protein V5A87_04995 [Candidatus Bipolaricaulota bacterium]|nr:hypothetical protein [Candidatus Bipolaricaulota bacterium]MBS3792197.1 hypothetical protein [Candidatus Bipolaricaulota bacterium]
MFHSRKLLAGISLTLAVFVLFGFVSPVIGQSNGVKGEVADSVLDKLLTFIDSAAEIIGKGLVRLVDMVAGVNVSDLEKPLGYLGVLTASLIVFGAIKAAQKIIWLILLLGWGLIIVRIVLEALDKVPAN